MPTKFTTKVTKNTKNPLFVYFVTFVSFVVNPFKNLTGTEASLPPH